MATMVFTLVSWVYSKKPSLTLLFSVINTEFKLKLIVALPVSAFTVGLSVPISLVLIVDDAV